jgi:hypothetical protein
MQRKIKYFVRQITWDIVHIRNIAMHVDY